MNQIKKCVSSFVAFATILWSVGGALLFPGLAQAATLSSGDLIKASGPAVYYYASNGKRYVFPNEKTYFSWYVDFSSVKTITDAELAAILIGGNVTIRPGTKLVKITTDPKTYAVSDRCGTLHWIQSETIANSLYGSNWAQRIVDVPDAFFVDYEVGSSISTAVHPDGTLIKYTGDSNTYVVMNGQKRMLTAAGISANKLNAANAIETAISYSNGADVTGAESELMEVSCGTAAPPAASGSVSVALATDSPAGVTLPYNAASVSLAKFNLTAGTDAALVTGLRIRRIGVGATADFSNVYLYDGNGTRLTTGRTINSSTNLVEFNGLNISVGSNQTVALVLVGDLSSPSTTGGQHAFEISDAASVVLSGSGTVGGSFPVRGNPFTVGTAAAGTLTVTKGTTPTNPVIGSKDIEVSNFKLAAATNDIEIRRITLLQAGDISNTDLTNFKLYQGSTVVATADAIIGDKIVLNFNPAYVIANGLTKTFSLHADVAGRASRTIKTYVEYTTDVTAIDRLYNAGAAVDIGTSGTFDGSTTGTKYIQVTTQGGQLSIAFNGPATANVAKASQDVVLYKFALTSPDNQIEVRRLRFRIDATDGGLLEESTTDYFTDIKVIDQDTGAVIAGPASLPATATSGTGFTLTDTFWIEAGQTRNLAITADLANQTDTDFVGHKYRACLSDDATTAAGAGTAVSDYCASSDAIFQLGDVKVVSTGENLAVDKIVPNTAISGNEMTVQNSSLAVALASSPSAGTAVKRQTDIPSAGFVFTAGSESEILVRTVTLTGVANEYGDAVYSATTTAGVITSCGLYDGDTQVGTAKSPDTTAGTMQITNVNVTIPAGSSKTLTVKCTADSTVEGTQDRFAVGILTAATDVVAEDKDNNTVVPTLTATVTGNAGASPSIIQAVRNSGVITVNAASHPASTIAIGGTAMKLAEFTATAQYEDVTVDRITVSSTGDSANFTKVAVLVGGEEKGNNILSSGQHSYSTVTLGTPITVNTDGVTIEVWGTFAPTVASSTVSGATTGVARSGNSTSLGIAAGVTASPWDSNYTTSILNIMATGKASGERLYASGASSLGNAMVLRKGKPVVTKLATGTALQNGLEAELYKFQIAPSADGGKISWKQMEFTVTTSSAVGLHSFKLYKGSEQMTDNTQVHIVNQQGDDITSTGAAYMASGTRVTVWLENEEVVSGSGQVYTLRATPVYSGSSATVSAQILRSTTVTTGYLGETADYRLGIDTADAADGVANVNGGFLWSDYSESPHSYTTTTSASRDWTNDVYVSDMSQTNTLTQ